MGAHPQTRMVGGHPGTRLLGRHPPPPADTRGRERRCAPASHMIPRERSRCLCRPQDTERPGWRVGESRVGARSPAAPSRDPQRCHGGSSPPSTGPRRPRGGGPEVCRAASVARGAAAVTASHRDGWPEGTGRAPPAAAQMFPRGTPPILRSPVGGTEQEGARRGREPQPPRLPRCPGPG